MNNGLMLAVVREEEVQQLMAKAEASGGPLQLVIDVDRSQVCAADWNTRFILSERHRRMFLDGLDVIGASLTYRGQIDAFAQAHWRAQPWLKDVARRTRARLDGAGA
jgi:3-isopropylmalate/(R)-2-methylmalate dehydratase small subunit